MPPPPVDRCDCQIVDVEGSVITTRLAVYPPATRMNGIYGVLGYCGSIAMLIIALASVDLFRRGKIPDARFFFWFLSGGLLLNLLPVRWFDWDGTFGENLHAWCLVLFTLAVPGLRRLPRLAIVAIALACCAEWLALDLQVIREQAVVLPSLLQEVDLSGKVIWQLSSAQLNQELAAATCAGCNITIVATHHDFVALPNGHLVVLASTQQVISGTTVMGDVVIDLDQNHNPV